MAGSARPLISMPFCPSRMASTSSRKLPVFSKKSRLMTLNAYYTTVRGPDGSVKAVGLTGRIQKGQVARREDLRSARIRSPDDEDSPRDLDPKDFKQSPCFLV